MNCTGTKKWSPLKIVGMVIGGIILAGLLAFLFGYVVMLLWNWLMPTIFGLGTIGYWQAVGLIILAKLLFGHIGGGGGSHDKKYMEKGPKEHIKEHFREEFKENFHKWKHYEGFWKEKGKDAFQDYVNEQEAEDTPYEEVAKEEESEKDKI